MAQTLEPARAEAVGVSFELEEFALRASRRLEIIGRWYGVRGRRFVRPTLTFRLDGAPTRLLADLEHKPWSPEEGESWIAAFPWDGDDQGLSEIELNVSPDVTVELSEPGAKPRSGTRSRRSPAIRSRGPLEHPRRSPREDRTAVALEEARREIEQLREELEQAQAAGVEAAAVIARRDAALGKLEAMTAERDRAAGQQVEALAARDAALAERDHAIADRDRALAERDRVAAHRDRALADARQAAGDRDDALARAQELRVSVEELQSNLESSRSATEQAEEHIRRAQRERDMVQASSAARSALMANAPVRRRHLTFRRPAAGTPTDWTGRAIAVVVLIIVLLALLLVTRPI